MRPTSRVPRFACFIVLPVQLAHDAERRCPRLGTRDVLDRRGPAVLAPVLLVDRVVQVMVCVLERDVDLEAAGRDVSCVVRLHAAEPGSLVRRSRIGCRTSSPRRTTQTIRGLRTVPSLRKGATVSSFAPAIAASSSSVQAINRAPI